MSLLEKARSPKDFNFVFGVSNTRNPPLSVGIFLAGINLKFLLDSEAQRREYI